MQENKSENIVKKYLRSLELDVSRIKSSDSDGKSPDYLVSDKRNDFLVEIKSRDEDENFKSLLENPYPGKESQEIDYNNTLSGIIRNGVKQLNNYDPDNENWHILWCFTAGLINSDLVARQFLFTSYGLKEVRCFDKKGNSFETGCFYFGYAEFYNHRNLDALVIQSGTEFTLCLNPFTDLLDQFKETGLYKTFAKEKFTVIDPKKLEKNKKYLFINSDIDRKDPNAVLEYIAEKYKLRKVTAINYELFNLPV